MKETYASDEAIIELYWQRDESALRETDRKYRAYLHAVARSILPDSRDCEECVNDTYLRTWNSIPPKRPQVLQAFLAKITRRLAIDRARKAGRERRLSPEHTVALDELAESLESGETVERSYESAVIGAAINRYLRSLGERDRAIFVRRYFCSERAGSIARAVGMSVPGVRKALGRMREGLRSILKEEGIEL